MPQDKKHGIYPSDLRKRAEALLQGTAGGGPGMSDEAIRSLVDELHIHQIELEIQNEELRGAQQELESAKSKYFDLYDLAPVGYLTLDPKGLILEANLTAAEMLGVQRYALEKTGFFRFVAPHSQATFYSHMEGAFKSKALQTSELELVRKDDTPFNGRLQSMAIHDSEGAGSQLRMTITDTSERVRAERKIRQSEQTALALLNASTQAALLLDADGTILALNEPACLSLGYEERSLVGRKVFDLFPREVARKRKERIREALELGRPVRFEDERENRHFDNSIYPVFDSQGRVSRLAVYAHDITGYREAERVLKADRSNLEIRVRERTAELEQANKGLRDEIQKRERAEAELRKHARELEWSNQELRDFAYVASHDLQEPLRKVQTFADILKTTKHDALDQEGQDYLRRIGDSTKRMRTLIQALLQYSSISAQGKPIVAVDLNDAAREALSNLKTRIEETHARIEVERLPVIEANRFQIIQLFQNMIGNAVKFHRPDETPEIRVYAELINERTGKPAKRVSNSAICRIFVQDNGIGFDPKFTERILQPFERLHSGSGYEGTGMGLAICRSVVARHGGHIEAQSSPGKGSIFIVTLPVRAGC